MLCRISGGVNLDIGLESARLSNQKNVSINSEIFNTYKSQASSSKPLLGFGVNYTLPPIHTSASKVVLNVGLDYYLFKEFQGQGIDHPFSNAGSFDTLNYSYRLNSSALFIEPKLVYTRYDYQPFLIFGVGPSFNNLSNFNEVPTNPGSGAAAPVNNFTNRSQTTFAAEVGGGIQHVLVTTGNTQLWYSIDYRYFNLGSSQFGPIPMQAGGEGFKLTNINVQTINVGLRVQVG